MLLNLWPRFLQDITEFWALAHSEQAAFDQAAEAVQGLHREFSLFTMTEYGAARWEALLGIVPAKSDTLEERRRRILAQYLSKLPYTWRSLARYLGQVTQGFTLSLDRANYTLYLEIILAGYNQQTAILAVVLDMLPANILLRLKTTVQQRVRQSQIAAAGGTLCQVTHLAAAWEREEE